jgi:hypothetical protein
LQVGVAHGYTLVDLALRGERPAGPLRALLQPGAAKTMRLMHR